LGGNAADHEARAELSTGRAHRPLPGHANAAWHETGLNQAEHPKAD
jgi:hypothetical protein